MRLLDNARRLAEWGNAPYHSNDWGMMWCGCCNGSMNTYLDHQPDCLFVTTMPRIMAALEAAERLIGTRASCFLHEPDEADEPKRDFETAPACYVFCHGSDGHRPGCPWQALVVALRATGGGEAE